MSKIKTFASSLGLKVTVASVDAINPIILKSAVNFHTFGNIVDDNGTPTLVDLSANTAIAITADSIRDAAQTALVSDIMDKFQDSALSVSEMCNTITSVTLEKGEGNVSLYGGDVIAFVKANKFKIDDVEIDVQNDVIFSTLGVKSLKGLQKHDDVLYSIDLNANTATVVNAAALTEQALADLKAGKISDAVDFVENFHLITKLVLVK